MSASSFGSFFLLRAFQEDKEPFLGPFVLEMFTTLLKKTVASVGGYGHPIGGLAMAVGAVHLYFILLISMS